MFETLAERFGSTFVKAIAIGCFLACGPSVKAAAPADAPFAGGPQVLMSLQDQCLGRAELSRQPDRMKAICVGWAILALDRSGPLVAKAQALRGACLRQVAEDSVGAIREHRRVGEAMCDALYASVAR